MSMINIEPEDKLLIPQGLFKPTRNFLGISDDGTNVSFPIRGKRAVTISSMNADVGDATLLEVTRNAGSRSDEHLEKCAQ